MSQALQRVVVRLLHDPAFVARVYEGQAVPELSDLELGWVRTTDRRTWGVDRFRRSRLLQALLEEFPVSGALRSITIAIERFQRWD